MIWYDIFVNCNWVDTRWRYYSTHLRTDMSQPIAITVMGIVQHVDNLVVTSHTRTHARTRTHTHRASYTHKRNHKSPHVRRICPAKSSLKICTEITGLMLFVPFPIALMASLSPHSPCLPHQTITLRNKTAQYEYRILNLTFRIVCTVGSRTDRTEQKISRHVLWARKLKRTGGFPLVARNWIVALLVHHATKATRKMHTVWRRQPHLYSWTKNCETSGFIRGPVFESLNLHFRHIVTVVLLVPSSATSSISELYTANCGWLSVLVDWGVKGVNWSNWTEHPPPPPSSLV